MSTNNMGGGYNPAKAVLDALGTDYVIEQGKVESDDGWVQWYKRWSSGLIEQWGCNPNKGPNKTVTITFPIPFSDSNYYARPANRIFNNGEWTLSWDSFYDLTTTSAKVQFTNQQNQGQGMSYYACGY